MMQGYNIPVVCPRCSDLVGWTDGKGAFHCEVWGGAVPVCQDWKGNVRIIGYTLICQCEYEWDWNPRLED